MSVIRQQNWLGQQRVDLPHLRSVESSIAADFDVLAGRALAGEQALVLRGFEMTGISVGAPATALQIVTANGVAFNRQATESGTFLWVPADRAVETLNPTTNGRVVGGWATGTTNYVGLDYIRDADATTSDIVQFKSANSSVEVPRQVALGKTLDYRIQISAVPFSAEPHLIPIAKVVVDSLGFIVTAEDARPMMFRLGSGGDLPQPLAPFAKWTREEYLTNTDNTAFQGGDKTITSMKDWMDATMTRMWEIGGGEFWYSATADRNVTLITYGPAFNNGEYFTWTLGSSTLQWKGLRMLFDNSTAYNADIADGTVVGLAPGECLYVDIDRTRFYAPAWVGNTAYLLGDISVNGGQAYEVTVAGTSAAGPGPSGTGTAIVDNTVTWKWIGPGTAGGLVPAKASLASLGTGTPAGSRWILAWRRADQIFIRGWRYPVGTLFTPATTTAQGVLKLSRDYASVDAVAFSSLNNPIAISDRGGFIEVPTASDNGLVLNRALNTEADGYLTGPTNLFGGTAIVAAGADSVDHASGLIGIGSDLSGVGVFGLGTGNAAGAPTQWGGTGVLGWSDGVAAGVRGDGSFDGTNLGTSSTAPTVVGAGLNGRGAGNGWGAVVIGGNGATGGGAWVAGGHASQSGFIATTKDAAAPSAQTAGGFRSTSSRALSAESTSTTNATVYIENTQAATGAGALEVTGDGAGPTTAIYNTAVGGGSALSIENESTTATLEVLNNSTGPAATLENTGTAATVAITNTSSSGMAFPAGKTMKKVLGGGDFKIGLSSQCTPRWFDAAGPSGSEANAIGTGAFSANDGSARFHTAFTLPLNAVITSVNLRLSHSGATGGVNAYLWLAKTTKSTNWSTAAIATAISTTLGLAAGATVETFAPTMNATVSNRTIQSTNDSVTVNLLIDTDPGTGNAGYCSLIWLEINYTMYDTLNW